MPFLQILFSNHFPLSSMCLHSTTAGSRQLRVKVCTLKVRSAHTCFSPSWVFLFFLLPLPLFPFPFALFRGGDLRLRCGRNDRRSDSYRGVHRLIVRKQPIVSKRVHTVCQRHLPCLQPPPDSSHRTPHRTAHHHPTDI